MDLPALAEAAPEQLAAYTIILNIDRHGGQIKGPHRFWEAKQEVEVADDAQVCIKHSMLRKEFLPVQQPGMQDAHASRDDIVVPGPANFAQLAPSCIT
jgi:hypothetical protein